MSQDSQKTKRRRLRMRLFRGNIRTLSLVSFLAGISSFMLRVNLQPFVLSLGASMASLGLLEAIGGYRGVITALVQPLAGWISDKKGRKIFVVSGRAMALTALILIVLASSFQSWVLLIPSMLLLGLSIGTSMPARDSAIAESVEKSERSVAFSILIFFVMVPGLFASVIGGYLADSLGFTLVFNLCVALQALSLILIFFMKETLNVRREINWSDLTAFIKSLFIPEKKMQKFYFVIALDTFSWGLGSAILFGLLSRTYNFSTFQLGIMSSIASLSSICLQLPIGILIKRFGCRFFMVASELAGIVMMVGWLTFTNFEALAALQVFMGIVISAWAPAIKTFVADSVPEEGRAEAIGKLAVFGGLAGFPAPYIGGFLYDMSGFQTPIFAGLVGVVLATMFIVLWMPKSSLD